MPKMEFSDSLRGECRETKKELEADARQGVFGLLENGGIEQHPKNHINSLINGTKTNLLVRAGQFNKGFTPQPGICYNQSTI